MRTLASLRNVRKTFLQNPEQNNIDRGREARMPSGIWSFTRTVPRLVESLDTPRVSEMLRDDDPGPCCSTRNPVWEIVFMFPGAEPA
jgi:hypothetical protein